MSVAAFTFGRMNPTTSGHEKLIDKVFDVARRESADPFVFVSQSQDNKKNPLSFKDKTKFLKRALGSRGYMIQTNKKIRTPFEALEFLLNQGYERIIFVVGSDRVSEFKRNMGRYIKSNFEDVTFEVESAGERDPDASDVSGISGSKMRSFAQNNDFKSFSKGLISGLNNRDAKEVFSLVQNALGVNELYTTPREPMKSFKEYLTELQIKTDDCLGIARCDMPQIKEKDLPEFMEYLKNNGIKVSETRVRLNSLKSTQNEINYEGVSSKMKHFEGGGKVKRFVVSKDNRIMDGHHQMFALKALGRSFVPAYRVNATMEEVLKLANTFPLIDKKDIMEV